VPLNTARWGLELRGTIATNDSRIVSLGGVPPTFVGASFIQQFNVDGFAPSSFFYKKIVSATIVPDTLFIGGVPTFVLSLAALARLRTVSLTYDLPDKLLMGATRASITVAGENLMFLWRAQQTSYGAKWIDPELLPNRSDDITGNFGYTQESWPQLALLRTTLRFTF